MRYIKIYIIKYTLCILRWPLDLQLGNGFSRTTQKRKPKDKNECHSDEHKDDGAYEREEAYDFGALPPLGCLFGSEFNCIVVGAEEELR